MNYVAFPGLNLEFYINRVAFKIFNIEIYWYAIIICTGLILGFLYLLNEGKRQKINTDIFYDLILIGLPSAIVGARLYYVIYKWDDYKENLLEIINLRGGGLAIYGGVIAAFLSAFIYLKIKKQNQLKVFDIASISFLIGQAIGRWGNFFNAEAYGKITNLPWRMHIIFSNKLDVGSVHPTFLYESLWNFTGAVILMQIIKKKKFDGQIFCGYLIWYGIGRYMIEDLRTDSLMFYGNKISQLVALLSVIGGIILYFYLKKRKESI